MERRKERYSIEKKSEMWKIGKEEMVILSVCVFLKEEDEFLYKNCNQFSCAAADAIFW